jgi:alpha-tubulin suppressor-like RCC1 family protein
VETAAGFEHSCALIAGRGVSCWGANGSKQLGLGPAGTNVFATADAIAVAAGGDRTCVVTNARGVACWGDNQLGLLGTGGGATLDTPAPVPELTDVAGLCMGSLHTCARTTAGTVHCWGANARGQVAILDLEAVTAPTRVPGLPADVVELACGGDHSCARTGSGDVWCWGENDDGEVDASGDVAVRAPRRLEAVCGATAIAAGYHHTCAATPVGLVCWGLNQYGELGGPSTQHLTIAGICDPSTPRLIESAPTDDAHRSRAAAR